MAVVVLVLLVLSLSSSLPSSRWQTTSGVVNAFQYHPSDRRNHPHQFRGNDASTVYSNSNQILARIHSIKAIIANSYTGNLVDDVIPRHSSFVARSSNVNTDTSSSSSSSATTTTNVLVIGGTSGIGQLVTQKLANSNRQPYTVRATSRSTVRGEELFQGNNNINVMELDLIQVDTTAVQQLQAAMEGVTVVVISVGTTAFPTIKWKDGNTPVAIDNTAVTRIAKLASQIASVQQVILVTSVGVERTKIMPFLILNLFGVLDAKRAGEDAVRQYSIVNSGYQYCIIRPGRLVGGPFTNLDVAKLLQIQGGTDNGVTMTDRKSTRLNSSHSIASRMPSSA